MTREENPRTPAPTAGTERRAHQRYDYSAPVTLRANDAEISGEVRNISLGGVLVDVSAKLAFGDRVELGLHFTELERRWIPCVVRWVQAGQAVGLQFERLEPIETRAMSRLIRKLADKADS